MLQTAAKGSNLTQSGRLLAPGLCGGRSQPGLGLLGRKALRGVIEHQARETDPFLESRALRYHWAIKMLVKLETSSEATQL